MGDFAWLVSAACKDSTKNTEISSDKKRDGDTSLLDHVIGTRTPAIIEAVIFQERAKHCMQTISCSTRDNEEEETALRKGIRC